MPDNFVELLNLHVEDDEKFLEPTLNSHSIPPKLAKVQLDQILDPTGFCGNNEVFKSVDVRTKCL